MDTEIGNPIEYNPEIDTKESEAFIPDNDIDPNQYYYPPQHQPMMMMMQPPQQHAEPGKTDIFANLDKTAYLVIFAAFILGFFMGKTMQPVILRHG